MAPDDRITEEEARRLWQRAAELQAEAAERHELARLDDAETEGQATSPEEGFELTHVRAAAQDAGIDGRFVDRALADLQAERLAGGDRRAPISRAVLADPPQTITASRRVHAPPEVVLRAMERLLPHAPFGLVLQDRHGDPARGGVLVFDIPGASFTPSTQEGLAMDASWADFREVHATVTPLGEGHCELTVRAPVAWAWKYNAWMAPFFVGVGGAASFGASLGLAVGVTALTGGVAALGGALLALGTGLGSYGSLLGYRAVYRYSLRKGRTGLEKLVAAVATEAQGGWGLTPADDGLALQSEVDPGSRGGGDDEGGGR